MARYINADALKKSIREETLFLEWQNVLIAKVIDDQPTVDAVPVVHGEWENGRYRSVDQTGETYDDGEALICTNCRCGFRKNVVDWRWKYCPACGARMDDND